MTRTEAIEIVERLMNGGFGTEAEDSAAIEALERGLVCPHVSDYIFWDFDPEQTPEKVVDRALAYEPFAL
ncbi:bacteriocin immunity protein [Streptomyces sp. TRM66268-LWL]|uniref:Bacteriocin immunity protein n=1 Tax=Streptomyces polyasparticus TaxID=2767826 RepID=A0ABR7SJX0_9ACTN|nr:bacteriocin immunity protein [Streptomyces polyasparticus]MBC9714628.1 bacteriocin immunity protein [Streptomyces polyasparticus]